MTDANKLAYLLLLFFPFALAMFTISEQKHQGYKRLYIILWPVSGIIIAVLAEPDSLWVLLSLAVLSGSLTVVVVHIVVWVVVRIVLWVIGGFKLAKKEK